MIALCVDDEKLLLSELQWAVEQSPDIRQTAAFDDETDALEWAAEHRADVAFLDIQLHDMDGLELARRLRELQPGLPVIFCTGFREYTLEAFHVHANGYLLKPVTPEQIQAELDHLRGRASSRALLRVRPYGGFAAFDRDGRPLSFHRSRSRELLALLFDRQGQLMTAREICEILWEDSDNGLNEKNRDYLYKLLGDLSRSLQAAGAQDVLKKTSYGHGIDPDLIEIDETGKDREPYMKGFSWAG